MQVILTVVGGVHNGRQVPISVPVFLIGRDPACHLRPASVEVSRQHCAIVVRDDRAFLRDYGSRNGTTLNHRVLMHGEIQLEAGDLLEVGPLVFKLTLVEKAVLGTTPEGHVTTGPILDQDTAIHSIGGDLEASPDDTALLPHMSVSPVMKGPRDSPEMLCPE